jgi:transposase
MIRTLRSCEYDDPFKAQKKPDGHAKQGLEFFKTLYEVERLARSDLPKGETRIDYTYWLRRGHSIMERDARPFTISRKSRLFNDTVTGAKACATVQSLTSTCRACNVEPFE